MMKFFLYKYVPFILVMCTIFYFSSLSVLPTVGIFSIGDKVLHFIVFFTLAYTLFRIFYYHSIPFKRTAILVIFLTTIYGLSDEIHQLYVPNRLFDYYDLLADFGGSIASVVIGQHLFKIDKLLYHFFFLRSS